jgi:hypothetical protein
MTAQPIAPVVPSLARGGGPGGQAHLHSRLAKTVMSAAAL